MVYNTYCHYGVWLYMLTAQIGPLMNHNYKS